LIINLWAGFPSQSGSDYVLPKKDVKNIETFQHPVISQPALMSGILLSKSPSEKLIKHLIKY